MTKPAFPNGDDAAAITTRLTGHAVARTRRYTTGNANHVFEVTLEDGGRIVARMTRADRRHVAVAAAVLNERLRPLGVPLPRLLGKALDGPFPTLLLEHLPGEDLGARVHDMTSKQLDRLTSQLAAMHKPVHALPSAGRYGFAASPAKAPQTSWLEVLKFQITRISPALTAEKTQLLASLMRHEVALNAIPATPFLHDTTTKNVLIGTDGRLVGIVDVDDLCWGDARFVIALTHVGMALDGGPTGYAADWLAKAGFVDDAPYRLSIALHALAIRGQMLAASHDNGLPTDANPRQLAVLDELYQQNIVAAQ